MNNNIPTLGELLIFILSYRQDKVFIGMSSAEIIKELQEASQRDGLAYHVEESRVSGIIVAHADHDKRILYVDRNLNITPRAVIAMCCIFDSHFKGYAIHERKNKLDRQHINGDRLVRLWARISARNLKRQQKDMKTSDWTPSPMQQFVASLRCDANVSGSSNSSAPVTPAMSGSTAAENMSSQVVSEMPAYYKALEAQMPGYTTAATNAANQANSSLMGADTSLYNQYAPLLNATSQQMGASNLQSNTNALSNTLGSPQANSLISGYNNLQGQMNPAYNSTMSGLSSMMQDQNPNALSGSEQAAISRGMSQQNYGAGNANVQNPLTNIGNAMLFGQGLQQKQSNFANLASSSANTANTLQGGQNAFGLATGQPSGTSSPNTSTSSNQFLTSPNNAFGLGNTSAAVGGGIMNQLGSTFNSANSAQAGQQASSGSSSSMGGGANCCFIFLEIYNGTLPWFVRAARDIEYAKEPRLGDGYKRMARWLVPLMQHSSIVSWLVNQFMVGPLSEQAGYQMKVEGCRARIGYKKFWWMIWRNI
jgi:hypothetical protein